MSRHAECRGTKCEDCYEEATEAAEARWFAELEQIARTVGVEPRKDENIVVTLTDAVRALRERLEALETAAHNVCLPRPIEGGPTVRVPDEERHDA